MHDSNVEVNQKIVKAALDMLVNPQPISPGGLLIHEKPYWCLAAVRLVLEKALGIKLYGKYVQMVAFPTKRNTYWARDFEKSLRDKGMALHDIEDAREGDIVCNHQAAYDEYYSRLYGQKIYNGHVGIIVEWNESDGIVFENVDPKYREGRLITNNKNLVLSTLNTWGAKTNSFPTMQPTTVIRFEPWKVS